MKLIFLWIVSLFWSFSSFAIVTQEMPLGEIMQDIQYNIPSNTHVTGYFVAPADGTVILTSSVDANTNLVPFYDAEYKNIVVSVRDEFARTKSFDVVKGTTYYFTQTTSPTTYFSVVLSFTKKIVTAISISLDKTEISLEATETAELKANVLPELATDKTVVWKSSNEGVATVDANGLVTAIAVGTADITATTTDGSNLTATCKATVNPTLATSITLDKTEATLLANEQIALQATVFPETTTNKEVEWISSNDEIAIVDQNGVVTGISRGEVVITATTLDGSDLTVSCIVKVKSMTAPIGGYVGQGTKGYVDYNEQVHTWAEAFTFTVYTTENNNAAFTADLSTLPEGLVLFEAIVDDTEIATLESGNDNHFKGQTAKEYVGHSTIRFRFRIAYGSASIETGTFEYQIAGETMVAIDNVETSNYNVKVVGNDIVVCNAPIGSQVMVYSIDGQIIAAKEVTDTTTVITVPIKGICIVKVGTETIKVYVK